MRDEGGEEKSGSRGRQAQGVAVTDNRAGAEKAALGNSPSSSNLHAPSPPSQDVELGSWPRSDFADEHVLPSVCDVLTAPLTVLSLPAGGHGGVTAWCSHAGS